MMLSYDTMDEAYPELIDLALRDGEVLNPRGFTCHELRPFSFRLTDPSRAIYGGMSRKLSARFWAIETLSYLAGLGDRPWHAELLCMANKGMQAFLNPDTKTFDGAYGIRIVESLEDIIQLFKRDPHTRQAVCSIWSPGLPVSKDVPCTVFLHFFRSQDRLQLQVYMRSNDLNWGTPYDVPAFCAIQLYVASRLDCPVGNYYHSCGSLHVYDNENDEKGQPGPPRILRSDEEWEHRVVPTVTDLHWIHGALNMIFQFKKGTNNSWFTAAVMAAPELPEPWLSMIADNRWAYIG